MSTITFSKFLIYLSIIVWLIPPFRQFRKSKFYFFLILALMDPIALIYFEIFKNTISIEYYLICAYLLLTSILWNKNSSKFSYLFILGGLCLELLLLVLNLNIKEGLLLIIFIQLVILFTFLKAFVVDYAANSKFNFFYITLIFYTLTVITKLFIVLIGLADATAFFHFTTIAQIFLGFYFSIYREDKTGNAV